MTRWQPEKHGNARLLSDFGEFFIKKRVPSRREPKPMPPWALFHDGFCVGLFRTKQEARSCVDGILETVQ